MHCIVSWHKVTNSKHMNKNRTWGLAMHCRNTLFTHNVRRCYQGSYLGIRVHTWEVVLEARTLNLPLSVLEKASTLGPFPFAVLLAWTLFWSSTFFFILVTGLITVGGAVSHFFRRLSPTAGDGSSVSSRARRRLKGYNAEWWARYEA